MIYGIAQAVPVCFFLVAVVCLATGISRVFQFDACRFWLLLIVLLVLFVGTHVVAVKLFERIIETELKEANPL